MPFPRPELLAHPNIPRPMQSLNPRSIKGASWWNDARETAYVRYNYRCWACGTPKEGALFHRWLEAHESYKIDYEKGRMELDEIVALCPACHEFIHCGRLWHIYSKGEISRDHITLVIDRGLKICKDNDKVKAFLLFLCARRDLNSHALPGATPSRWCVCQFHHSRMHNALKSEILS